MMSHVDRQPVGPSPTIAERVAGLSPSGRAFAVAVEVLLVLVLWQLAVDVFDLVNRTFLPPPLDIAGGFKALAASGELIPSLLISLKSWGYGFAIALVVGIPLGLLMGASLPVDRIVSPIAWVIYAAPAVAYQPLAKAWFGFGSGPVVFLVAIFAVFPILFNVAAGMRTTNKSLVRAARVYGASEFDVYRRIYLPSTVPLLFAGLRQAAVLATIGMIVAEMTGSSKGLGSIIIRSANTYQTAASFAAIVIAIVWSVAFTQLVGVVERVVAPWNRRVGVGK